MTNELGQVIVDYDYDPAGRLSRKTLGNGVFTTYTYNSAGQVTQLVNSRADSNVLSSFSYTYDASGRRASMTTLAGTETYGYDPLGQLTSVTYPNSRVVNYAYDAAGNRTQVTDNGVPATYAANTLNQYTSAGAATFGYDLDGNLTNKTESATNTVYTYDIENRLIGVATPTDNWTYAYDAFGNRIAATHNGQITRYVIDPTGLGNVAAEYDGGGSLIARYEHGFGLLARTDAAGGPAFYTFSAIGHTSELTGPSGAVANAYAYDPFGLSLAKTETIPNPFEFVGEFGVMNEGNGLEFMRARFYSAQMGRFVSIDPVGLVDSANLYQYALNDPTIRFDPSGEVIPVAVYLWGYVAIRAGQYVLAHPYSQRMIQGGLWYLQNRRLLNKLGENLEDIVYLPYRLGEYNRERVAPWIWDSFLWWDDLVDRKIENLAEHLGEYPDPNPIGDPLSWFLQLFRSRDPNDKLGPSGYGSASYLPAGGVMAYQIRFENQPSATAPAQRVTVTDPLDPNLDLSTFELTEIAFANQTLALPAGLPVRGTQTGLNHYETRLWFTVTNQTLIPRINTDSISENPCNSCLVVDVQAALNLSTRELRIELTALDPNTGWYPEDPLTGFLYPNNTNHVGEGSFSYLVRPSSGLPTGATITNRADIVFDYNDPIVTPLVLNTIDAITPTSAVATLAPATPSPFLVQWSGQDEPSGSGIASFDIYVSEDGTNFQTWLTQATNTSASFSGGEGRTYYFYSIARDNVGHEELPPTAADAHTLVSGNTPPVLNPISNQAAIVGQNLSLTNVAFDLDYPPQRLTFSLGPGAPGGASITTNGIFHWTPACEQGSSTNSIQIQVTDDGAPPLSSSVTFVVAVSECVRVGVGRAVMLTNQNACVPVSLLTTVPLTNLSFVLEVPANHLTNWVFVVTNTVVSTAAVQTIDLSRNRFIVGTGPGLVLEGPTEIGWICFDALPVQSAFVPLVVTNVLGLKTNGTYVGGTFGQSGRVILVGDEPLLEALRAASNQVQLLQYAIPGSLIEVQWTTNLPPTSGWLQSGETTQTNLIQEAGKFAPAVPVLFFRAVRENAPP